jgi:hypothetical protein
MTEDGVCSVFCVFHLEPHEGSVCFLAMASWSRYFPCCFFSSSRKADSRSVM